MTQQTHTIVSGVVRDHAGYPIGQARVYFVSGPGPLPDIATLTDDNGSFVLSVPLSGPYVLACTADDHESSQLAVEVSQGQATTVDFNLALL